MADFPIPADWDNRPPPKGFNRGVYARFRPDHKSFGKFILSDQVRDPVHEIAEAIMLTAKANTPRAPEHRRGRRVFRNSGVGPPPHMQDLYRVERNAGTIKVDKAFRVKVEVHNDDPESALVEFGSAYNVARHMLARAGAAFGDYKSKVEI
jgi:hypothetical protein